MKKAIVSIFTAIATATALAEPGFKYAMFTGSDYNGASDIWSNASSTVLSASRLYSSYGSSSYQHTTFTYGAYMYLKGGTTYFFRAWYDDYASVKVDDTMVVPRTVGCQQGNGAIRFASSGWHKIELRVSNITGPSGNVSGSSFTGIHYSEDNSTWKTFADSGDGALFRTDLPAGETINTEVDHGAPGFRLAVFTGSGYDGSSSIWDAPNQRRTLYAAMAYVRQGNDIPEHTTYAYGAMMYMEAGVTYKFKAFYDDFATVKIDNTMVISKPSGECQNQSGSIAIGTTGWHRIEVRVSNNGGGGGSLYDSGWGHGVVYSTNQDSGWRKLVDDGTGRHFRIGYGSVDPTVYDSNDSFVWIESSKIRETDPTILDVVYKIISPRPTVRVRFLAFEDGERSFAKVVRPETFVDRTAPANWDAVEANVEHRISWRVSSDWQTRLAKLKFEVLVSEGGPFKLTTQIIPESDSYGRMKVVWSDIKEAQLIDVLFWLYADHDENLKLSGGVVRCGGTILAKNGACFHQTNSWGFYPGLYDDWDYRLNAASYIFSRMGYTLLTGGTLAYVNDETRLGFMAPGQNQWPDKIAAYKIIAE